MIYTYPACNTQCLLLAAKDVNCSNAAVSETNSNDSTTQNTGNGDTASTRATAELNGIAALSSSVASAVDSNRLDQSNHAENNSV